MCISVFLQMCFLGKLFTAFLAFERSPCLIVIAFIFNIFIHSFFVLCLPCFVRQWFSSEHLVVRILSQILHWNCFKVPWRIAVLLKFSTSSWNRKWLLTLYSARFKKVDKKSKSQHKYTFFLFHWRVKLPRPANHLSVSFLSDSATPLWSLYTPIVCRWGHANCQSFLRKFAQNQYIYKIIPHVVRFLRVKTFFQKWFYCQVQFLKKNRLQTNTKYLKHLWVSITLRQ